MFLKTVLGDTDKPTQRTTKRVCSSDSIKCKWLQIAAFCVKLKIYFVFFSLFRLLLRKQLPQMPPPRSLRLTLHELRIAKFGKKKGPKPCTYELEAFLASVGSLADNGDVDPFYGKALTDCMDNRVCIFQSFLLLHLIYFIKLFRTI